MYLDFSSIFFKYFQFLAPYSLKNTKTNWIWCPYWLTDPLSFLTDFNHPSSPKNCLSQHFKSFREKKDWKKCCGLLIYLNWTVPQRYKDESKLPRNVRFKPFRDLRGMLIQFFLKWFCNDVTPHDRSDSLLNKKLDFKNGAYSTYTILQGNFT